MHDMFQEAKIEDIMENIYMDLQLGSYFLRPSVSWMRRNFHGRESRLHKDLEAARSLAVLSTVNSNH